LQRHQRVASGQLRPPSALRHERGRSAQERRGSDPLRDLRKERKEKRMKAGPGPPPAGPPSGACTCARCCDLCVSLFDNSRSLLFAGLTSGTCFPAHATFSFLLQLSFLWLHTPAFSDFPARCSPI
jgi:hypothetical protein